MAGEYIVPLGTDLSKFVEQIREGRQAVGQLSDTATESSKEMDAAFKATTSVTKDLVKVLTENTAVNKDLANTLKVISTENEKTNESKRETVSIESALNKELEKTIATAKTQLSTLKEGSKEYNKLAREIQAAEVGLKTLGKTGADTGGKLERLRKTFAENRAVLQNLYAQGLQNTKMYKDLEKVTGELSDTINDVNEAVKLAGSDTRSLDNLIGSAQAITGAFTVAQGAVALFGDENENLQKALLRVNAALSILNGLQAIQSELKRKDSFASKAAAAAQGLYATVVGTSTGALKAFRVALASTGIGLIVIAIGALITNFDAIKNKVLELFPGLKTLSDFIGGLVQKFTDLVGFTSEAERALDEFAKATELRNKAGERAIKLLEAQGGKEKEIYIQRRDLIRGELQLLNERERVNKKLTEEEFERRAELLNDLQVLDADEQRRLNETAEEKKKKEESDRKDRLRKETEAKDKLIAIAKDQAERILAFDKQYRDLKIAAIDDEFQRSKALEDARFQDVVDAARKTVEEFKGTDEQRAQIQEAANRVIEQEFTRHLANLTKLQTDYSKARIQSIQNANALSNDVFASDLDRELQDINEKYAKSIADLEKIIAQGTARNPEIEAIESLNRLKLAKEVEFNAARKKIRDKAADENADALKKEEAEYKNFAERINGFFSKILTDSGLSPEEADQVIGTVKKVFTDLQDAFIETVDKQIEGKQRQIDALTSQIDESQDELERELELQKQGYANNVGAKQKEVEDLKALRQKEAEDEKKLQIEKAKLESLDIARATVQQTVDLGTAAAKIFKAHAGIPFVGIALAGAAVAAMFAGFLAIKNKIKAAQDAVPKFRKGGNLDIDALRGASSHESGGVKMIDNNSGEVLAELQGDEKLFVVNKKSSEKYDGLLRAINRDDTPAIQSMLKEVGGVHLMENVPRNYLRQSRIIEAGRVDPVNAMAKLAQEKTLKDMASELAEFRKQDKNRKRVFRYYDRIEEVEGNNRKIYKLKDRDVNS
jgi:hypothetical protein